MKRVLVLLFGLLGLSTLLGQASAAEDPLAYRSLHQESSTIGSYYISNGQVVTNLFTVNSFRDRFDPNNEYAACAMHIWSGSCNGAAATVEERASMTLGGADTFDGYGRDRFKFYLPPGTVNFNFIAYTPQSNRLLLAVKLGEPPATTNAFAAGTNDQPVSSNYERLLNGDELIIEQGDGANIIMATGPDQTALTEGRWLYVHVINNDYTTIYKMQGTIYAQREAYINWFNNNASWGTDGDPLDTPAPEPLSLSLSSGADYLLSGNSDQLVVTGEGSGPYVTTVQPEGALTATESNGVITVTAGTPESGETSATLTVTDQGNGLSGSLTVRIVDGGTEFGNALNLTTGASSNSISFEGGISTSGGCDGGSLTNYVTVRTSDPIDVCVRVGSSITSSSQMLLYGVVAYTPSGGATTLYQLNPSTSILNVEVWDGVQAATLGSMATVSLAGADWVDVFGERNLAPAGTYDLYVAVSNRAAGSDLLLSPRTIHFVVQ